MLKIRDMSLFSQSVAKFWNVLFATQCSHILQKTTYPKTNQDFDDSCVNQLLAITHEIFPSFDDNYEVRWVFLDLSKAFDKVLHEGTVYKVKRNGISGNLLSLITDFLRNRKQRVIFGGRSSSWANINAGVPQGQVCFFS